MLFSTALGALLLFSQSMGSGSRAVPRPAPAALKGKTAPVIDLRDVAAAWGVVAPNEYGGRDRKTHIVEMTGNGAVLFDADNDGAADILLLNGDRRPGVFYRNDGKGRFSDATAASGLSPSGWTQGACAGDYDNDGFTDLLVTRYGTNLLYHNERGRFRETATAAGVAPGGGFFHTGCTFLDYDRDGRLDLFVSSYVAFSPLALAPGARNPLCNWRGLEVFCGPRGFAGGVNHLFHNEGGGRFRDVSVASGIRLPGLHYGLSAVAADLDGDGWPDIYVACDSTPSILYRNNRDGTFTDIAVPAGVSYGENGEEQGGMGTAAADYDSDGRLDLVRSNFIDETTTLYRNEGDGFFSDVTAASGLGVNTKFVGWGIVMADLDHDGFRDLLVANGHIYPELQRANGTERFEQTRLVYWNSGDGIFRDVTAGSGTGATAPWCSRGLAAADLDGDGALEFLVINQNAAPALLKNYGTRGNWLIVRLEGTRSNRSAIGARVTVTAGSRKWTAEVQSGGSYLSQSGFDLHFGLADALRTGRIEVRWPNGAVESFPGVAANQRLSLREGSSAR